MVSAILFLETFIKISEEKKYEKKRCLV